MLFRSRIAVNLAGPYRLLPSAVEWGVAWYEEHYKNRPAHLDDERFGGYIARKQTHIHKLAMVIAAAQRDELTLSREDLAAASLMVSDLEQDMPQVFAKIGKTEQSNSADRFIDFVRRRQVVPYAEAYRFVHSYFPDVKDFEGIVSGAIRAGFIAAESTPNGLILKYAGLNGTEKKI